MEFFKVVIFRGSILIICFWLISGGAQLGFIFGKNLQCSDTLRMFNQARLISMPLLAMGTLIITYSWGKDRTDKIYTVLITAFFAALSYVFALAVKMLGHC